MKPIEIVEMIKQTKPEALGKIPEKRAAMIIRNAFLEIAKVVGQVDEGAVRVPGFGVFQVRQVEREKDGVKQTVKRVFFKPAETKSLDAE